MKFLFGLLLSIALAGTAGAQKKAVDKAARQPDRATQSGRADVYIQDKSRISDDSTAVAAPQKPCGRKNKKGTCRKRRPQ